MACCLFTLSLNALPCDDLLNYFCQPALGESLEQVEDADQLKHLLRQSILVASLAEFQALLSVN